jgi:hypothetical protein
MRYEVAHCATSRKVAVSIPDGVTGIFHSHKPSGRTMALGLTQPLTEMSKVKFTLYRPPRAYRGSSGIALLFHDLGARRGWVVSTRPRPFYPRERPGTHCTGGWVGPRAGLKVWVKSRPTGIRFPDRPARSQSLYRLSYPAPNRNKYQE